MKKISVLLPCYNEEENVEAISRAVIEQFEEHLPQYDYELLFIDNASTDNTRPLLRKMCSENRHIKAILNTKNFGQFNSPFYGLLQTEGDCAICMVCDFQTPPELIPTLVSEWEKGYMLVTPVKKKSRENPLVYLLRRGYYKMLRKMSDVEIIENFNGWGLYDRSFVDVLRRLDDPSPFFRGMVAEFGYKRKEVEYVEPKRRAGKSHNNFYTLYDAAMLSFTSYTKVGMRLATMLGFGISMLSFLIALLYLILKLVYWDRFDLGNAPMLIGIFALGGVQTFFIGLLGEYIMSINTRVMRRPLVIEEERLNFDDAERKESDTDEKQT